MSATNFNNTYGYDDELTLNERQRREYEAAMLEQAARDRGNVSGGVLDEPSGSLYDTPATVNPDTASTNPDGSVTPAGAQGPATDPASINNPGTMADIPMQEAGAKASSWLPKALSPFGWLLIALASWWLWKKYSQ